MRSPRTLAHDLLIRNTNSKRIRIRLKEFRITNSNSYYGEIFMNSSITLRTRILALHQQLINLIPPRNQSDRTSFRNIANWCQGKIESGDYDEDFPQVLIDFAVEAAQPTSRNPAAVFTSILKKELGYPN